MVHVLVFYPLLNWKMHGETMKIVKTICESDKPHPYPERSSPTRLSTWGCASYKGWSCIQDWNQFWSLLLESQDHMDCIQRHSKSGLHPNILFLFHIYFNITLIYGKVFWMVCSIKVSLLKLCVNFCFICATYHTHLVGGVSCHSITLLAYSFTLINVCK